MDANTTRLVELVKEFKNHLSPSGEYSICKADGGAIPLWECMTLGALLENIDKVIDDIEQVKPQPLLCTCKLANEGSRSSLTGHTPSCPVDKAFYNDRDAYMKWVEDYKSGGKAAQG